MSNGERIGLAYDAVAADYDRKLEPAGWIRRALWRHFDRVFGPGDRILDIGCGTGTDAIHLARNHVRVTAVDASAEMLARLRAKLARESPRLQGNIDVQCGNVDDVGRALVGPFDGIISSFAALNTVDLSTFALHAARLLRRGGRFVCHMLSTGHGQSAWARLLGRRAIGDAPGARIVVVGGEPLTHLDVAPDEIYRRFFRTDFDARGGYALGLFVNGAMEARLPERLLDLVGHVEPIIGAVPALAAKGRFFVLDLERRPS